MVRTGWLLAVSLVALQARAQDWSGQVRLQLGQEYDSNALRVNSPTAPGDFLTRLVAQGRLAYSAQRNRLWLDYQGGGKFFYHQFQEHQLASRIEAGARRTLPHDRSVGIRLTLRDVTQARHSRDYTQFGADLFANLRPLPRLSLEAWLGARRYDFKPDGSGLYKIVKCQDGSCTTKEILFSNAGPAAGLQLSARLGPSWSAGLSYQFGLRFFDDAAYRFLEPGTPEAEICKDDDDPQEQEIGCYTPTGRKRQDLRNTGGASLRFKTAWLRRYQLIAQASYLITHNLSNSTGNSAIWHRVRAVVSAQFPLDLTLHLMGTVQLTSYPDGRNLLLDFYEPDADENENSFVARLTWRFWAQLSLVAQAAVYRSDFQFGTASQPAFERETFLLGVAWDSWF